MRRAETAAEHASDNKSENDEEENGEFEVPAIDGLLSWAVGVAFGRFDWRLATGERQALPEPDPFDPLPRKSPGMLPDGTGPFCKCDHWHLGRATKAIRTISRISIEEVIARVDS